MFNFKLLLIFVLLVFGASAFAQTDPNVVEVDTTMRNPGTKPPDTLGREQDSIRLLTPGIKSAKPVSRKDTIFKDAARLALEKLPRQAALRSAILPGLGQIKNGRWWKVPFVYGGFVGLGLIFEFNNRYYLDLLEEVQFRADPQNKNKISTTKYSDPQISFDRLKLAKDSYRRNRDLSILAGVAFYAVQIIDAYVDAKFFRFDISDELSFNVAPTLQTPPFSHAIKPVPAFKIKFAL